MTWVPLTLALAAAWLAHVSLPLAIACVALAVVTPYRGVLPDRVIAGAALTALVVSSLLPWWRRPAGTLDVSIPELLMTMMLSWATVQALLVADRSVPNTGRARAVLVGAFFAISFWFSFNTGVYHAGDIFLTAWHHWGAYIGPAEAMQEGARVFRDIPAQYGLGPTALIALTSGDSGWDGMYYVVGLTTWGYTLLVGWVAWRMCGSHASTLKRAVVLLMCLLTTLLWTSYPPLAATATVTPSVGGLRFLPSLGLVALLVERKAGPAPVSGYLLWAFAVLWSPESAFCATFVWWPYALWSACAAQTPGRRAFIAIIRQSAILIASLFALVAGFLATYWLVYRTTPTLYGVFCYVLNPPGPLPINPRGAIWFFIAVVVCGVATLCAHYRNGDTKELRGSFAALLLAYSTFSYFLGRSHDNNLLNLLPFQMLVLLSTLRAPLHRAWHVAAAALLAATVAWCSVFGWQIFTTAIADGRWSELAPDDVRASFTFTNASTQAQVRKRMGAHVSDPADAGHAVAWIKYTFREPMTVIDGSMDIEPSATGDVWSAIHGPANFTFVPSRRRRQFLRRTAARLRRCGWVIVDENYPTDDWLADYAVAYRIERELDFGSYRAIRYVPRVLSSGCPLR